MIDWKLAIFLLQAMSILITVVTFLNLKLNDIKHMGMDVSKIDSNLSKIFKRLGKIEKAQATRDAICQERHPKK